MFSSGAAQVSDKTYVDDVFSTYLYTGNGTTQTITNGIDLAGNGGLVWIKARTIADDHRLFDTDRPKVAGNYVGLSSDLADTGSQFAGFNSFNSNGFSLSTTATAINGSGNPYTSWTFRKAPKFFDVVTYTGDGTSTKTITHSLGVIPGMIVIKATSTTGDWLVTTKQTATKYIGLKLNTTDPSGWSYDPWDATSTSFTVGSLGNTFGSNNTNGVTYVAYLFAHDTSTDGLIQCGSFTTDASGNATVNLGWEPQWVLCKRSDSASSGDWFVLDSMRSLNLTTYNRLYPNLSAAEGSVSGEVFVPTATGFYTKGIPASAAHIYLAIRRPNKPPTTGTQVYNAIARTGTGAAATVTGAGFAPDAVIADTRNAAGYGTSFFDRLRGANQYLSSGTTSAESNLSAQSTLTAFGVDGVSLGNDLASVINSNSVSQTYINWFFRRAPGFMDVVCYTGTGANNTVAHGLGVVPELMIVKKRNAASSFYWGVYAAPMGASNYLALNTTDAVASNTGFWNSTSPTSSVFSVGAYVDINQSGGTFVAYLFATLPGISKVGSYTGNGSSQTINCGFSTGARFILIKRTDSTGDWYVWDTARGIIAANDPHLSLNTTAAEVTTDDSIDPDSTGFIVNQVAATNINVSSATYLYLAIA